MIAERPSANHIWQIDPAHSTVEFTVTHPMITTVGVFREFSGALIMPADGILPVSVQAEIVTSSIETRQAELDAHLCSADFFAVECFPTITFKSTAIHPSPGYGFGGNALVIKGLLTIHDVTQAIVLDTMLRGTSTDLYGDRCINFLAHCTLSCKEFDLPSSQTLDTGGSVFVDVVEVSLEVQAIATTRIPEKAVR